MTGGEWDVLAVGIAIGCVLGVAVETALLFFGRR